MRIGLGDFNLEKRKSIKANLILNTIKTLSSIIFPLLTFPYVSRILHAENIGKVHYAASIISYFALVASLGISTYAIRSGAGLRNNKEKLNKFCNQIFTINMISTLVAYIGIGIMLLFVNDLQDYRILIIIESMTIIFTTLGVDWINSIFEDFKYITIRSIGIQVLTLVLTFVFIHQSNDYYIYAIISVISSVGANILNIFYVRKYCRIRLTTNIEIKKNIKPIMLLFSNYISGTIYKSSDITMLGAMCGEETVGIYYVAVKIYNIAKQLLNSIITVILPRIAHYEYNNLEKEKDKLLNKVFKAILISTFPIIVGMIMLRNEIIQLISSEEYMRATTSFVILTISLFFAVVANFTSNMILIVHKQEKRSLTATIVSSTINVILNFYMIPKYQEVGAAITTLIAEIIMASYTGMYAYKYYRPTQILRTLVAIFVGCIMIVLECILLSQIPTSSLLKILLETLIGGILYSFSIFLLDRTTIHELIKLKNRPIKKFSKRT